MGILSLSKVLPTACFRYSNTLWSISFSSRKYWTLFWVKYAFTTISLVVLRFMYSSNTESIWSQQPVNSICPSSRSSRSYVSTCSLTP